MNLVINENDVQGKDLGGRVVTWLQTPELTGGQYCSVCKCVYEPGARAKPAHGHDAGEETIYVVSGEGKVKIGDEIFELKKGSLALFPQGVPHMVWNTGSEPLELTCFYAPNQEAIGYTFYEDFDFPEFQK